MGWLWGVKTSLSAFEESATLVYTWLFCSFFWRPGERISGIGPCIYPISRIPYPIFSWHQARPPSVLLTREARRSRDPDFDPAFPLPLAPLTLGWTRHGLRPKADSVRLGARGFVSLESVQEGAGTERWERYSGIWFGEEATCLGLCLVLSCTAFERGDGG